MGKSTPVTVTLYLYSTSCCHLCEQASEILSQLSAAESLTVEKIDIADDNDLLQRYGFKIPVLHHAASGELLCWPFSEADIIQFLHQVNTSIK